MLRIDALRPEDVSGALRLSTQAGWNQTAEDWRRLIDLSPAGCIAGRVGDALVATATAVVYDARVAWIGMVLVDEAWRGRGFGTAMLAKSVDLATELGAAHVGLDATEIGRPVYLKSGFFESAPIERWGGVLGESPVPGDVLPIDRSCLDEVVALDREACGVDRGSLLRHLFAEPGVSGWFVRAAGYAFLRPGRDPAHLGPVVAADPMTFEALLERAACKRAGKTVILDVVRTSETTRILAARGLSVRRPLTRMTLRRSEPLLMGARVRAAAAFEWG